MSINTTLPHTSSAPCGRPGSIRTAVAMSEDIDTHVVSALVRRREMAQNCFSSFAQCRATKLCLSRNVRAISQLRKYEIKQKIGRGAYGIVWKAVDKETGYACCRCPSVLSLSLVPAEH